MSASDTPLGISDTARGAELLPPEVVDLLGPYLGRQRWYAGTGTPAELAVVDARVLPGADGAGAGAGARACAWWAVVEADGTRYQLLVGRRPDGEPADFLSGREAALLGSAGSHYYYDAALDPELSLPLLGLVSGGREEATRVRPITAEQSNTSLVYDDRVIMKVFRRLLDGPNPDVEVTIALAGAGFAHVAAPVATWRQEGVDMMFAQRFLSGASEGWALALTSLRDLYGIDDDTAGPGDAGGDFAAEARRLGRVTADMHLTMARTFGVESGGLSGAVWESLVDDIEARVGATGADLAERAAPVVAHLRAVVDPGPAMRVHGDYHLGQVMRTDLGWYVLDFEGEPARALHDRVRASSPLKDVTGMLRSLHYATRVALRERADAEVESLAPTAEAWEQHNRDAFLDGYHRTEGIAELLPAAEMVEAVAAAYELDKALYELDYERSYRPDWVAIPLGATARIVERLRG